MWVLSGELSAPWRRLVGLPYRPPIKMHTHILYKIKHTYRIEAFKNASEFVGPFSSAYIGTVEGGSADSRKIPIKIRITMRIFSL